MSRQATARAAERGRSARVTAAERRIPTKEITFHPHSFGDPDGRLFRWKDALYRGISQRQEAFFSRLFDEGLISTLVERGLLVESEVVPLTLDGYAMVLRHRLIPFVSYPEEWPPVMLKDAALVILDLALELSARGLSLKDGHPWNVVFDGCHPVYVDITSIVPLDDQPVWPAYDSFCRFAFRPLVLMANGHERIVRRLLPDYDGIGESELLALTRGTRSALIRSTLGRLGQSYQIIRARSLNHARYRGPDPRQRFAFLKETRKQVEGIALPAYGTAFLDALNPFAPDSWALIRQEFDRILDELRPESVLDVGTEAGWAARTAAHRGSRVVALCTDSRHATQLYHDARGSSLRILPLVMDFVDPTPSRGIDGHWAIAATERFGCDLVVASSAVVRAAWQRCLPVDQIVDGLRAFARRRLLLELAPIERHDAHRAVPDDRPPCSADVLAESLHRHFSRVEILPTHQEERVHLLCSN